MNNQSVEDILHLINTVASTSCAINIWVPSLINTPLTELKFKPLTGKQQQDILKISLERNTFIQNKKFAAGLYDIITQNFIPNDLFYSVDQLTNLDQIFILLSLRANANPIYNHIEDNKIVASLNISDIIDKFKKSIILTDIIIPQKYNNINFEVDYFIPTIASEYNIEINKNIPQEEDIAKQLEHIIVNTVSSELAKFCTQIKINGECILDSSFAYQDTINILNSIPSNVLEPVLEYIIKYKKFVEENLTSNIENKQILIKLDSTFFTSI